MKVLFKFLSVFMLALVVTACSSDDTPEAVTKKFFKTNYTGDLDGLFETVYIPETPKANGENAKSHDFINDAFDDKEFLKSKMKRITDQAVAMAQKNGGFDRVELSPTQYNSDKTEAYITATIIFKDGTMKTNSALSLIKVEDKWLITFN